jgi:pimeloyl-ACP methyl ester carboxylesterase
VSGTIDEASFRVLAAPGIGLRFDARFSLAADRSDGTAEISQPRHSARLPETESDFDYERERGDEVAEHPAAFRAVALGTVAGARIYRVDVTEGTGKGIFLLSVARAEGRLVLDSLLVATDARHYNHCANARVPATATEMRPLGTPLPIDIDVEPAHSRSIFDEDENVQQRDVIAPWIPAFEDSPERGACAWQGQVTWDAARGFVVERVLEECDLFPRGVTIGEDGTFRVTGAMQRTQPDPGVTYLPLGRERPDALVLLPDPDYDIRLWLELMEKLAGTRTVVALSPSLRAKGDDATIVGKLAADIQEVVDAIGARRVFVIAHGLSAPYALEWAKAHPDLAAGVLLMRSPEDSWSISNRVHAVTGSDADRLEYLKNDRLTRPSTMAARIVPYMLDRSRVLTVEWLKTFAALLAYPQHETVSAWKGARIWRLEDSSTAYVYFFPMLDFGQETLSAIERMLATAFEPKR